MAFANFGVGVGAFAEGLERGMRMGDQMRESRNRNEIETIRRQGLEAARRGRDEEVQGIQRQAAPALENEPVKPVWNVDGTMHTDQASAQQAADKRTEKVASVEERFLRDTVPQIRDTYLAQGNPEKALAWENYSEQQTSKKFMKDWSDTFSALQRGDWDTGVRSFGAMYNEYLDDGVEYSGHTLNKDDEGNVTGAVVKLKNTETGKTSEMPLDRERLVNMVMENNPQAQFDALYEQMQTADQARLDAAERAQEHQYTLQEIAFRASQGGENAPADVATAEWLVTNEVAPDKATAYEMVRSRQNLSEQDLRAQAVSDLSQTIQWRTMSEAEREAEVEAYMKLIRGAGQTQGTGGNSQPNPAASGVPILQNGQQVYQ